MTPMACPIQPARKMGTSLEGVGLPFNIKFKTVATGGVTAAIDEFNGKQLPGVGRPTFLPLPPQTGLVGDCWRNRRKWEGYDITPKTLIP